MLSATSRDVYIAEQVAVKCPAAVVASLLARRRTGWLQPFAQLAWREGQMAVRTRALTDAPANTIDHEIRLAPRRADAQGSIRFELLWRVRAASSPFHLFCGTVTVAELDQVCVISVCGRARGGNVIVNGTSHTPGETVLRSLIGHLRTAITATDDRDR